MIRLLTSEDLKPLLRPEIGFGLATFTLLFWDAIRTLGRDWWNDPEAGHGLLIAPLAVYLAWRAGIHPNRRAQPILGLTILFTAVVLRYASGLAAELFTLRMSMFGAIVGLIVFAYGFRQIVHWWLPTTLLVLTVPIPAVVLNTVAFPLQLTASKFGASLLEFRDVPVLLAGNVIHLPGQSLFVTEACSGLRSLTALLALGILIGGLWLQSPVTRLLLVAITIPCAVLLNGVRVFMTGFLVYYVDPVLGDGFMHLTEGWVTFIIEFAIVGLAAFAASRMERTIRRWRAA